MNERSVRGTGVWGRPGTVARWAGALLMAGLAFGCKSGEAPAPEASAAATPEKAKTPDVPKFTTKRYPTPAAALEAVLASKPKVVGFGELHELADGPKVSSAIGRFTREMLATTAKQVQALVVETWVTDGECGEQEKAVVAQVEETTKRPEHTEDEVVTLLKAAKAAGVQPAVLELSCDEYAKVNGEGGEVDYGELLTLIGTKLGATAKKALDGGKVQAVAIYGGALHNDRKPEPGLEDFSFGPAMAEATEGAYVEVDLLVPELAELDEDIQKAPWFGALKAFESRSETLVIDRGHGSYALVLPRGPKAE